MGRDKVRSDWAALASLAEVHEQDLSPSRRLKTQAAERLWIEIVRLRAENVDLRQRAKRGEDAAQYYADKLRRVRTGADDD